MKSWLKQLHPGELLAALIVVVAMFGGYHLVTGEMSWSHHNQDQLTHSEIKLDNSFIQEQKSFDKFQNDFTKTILLQAKAGQ